MINVKSDFKPVERMIKSLRLDMRKVIASTLSRTAYQGAKEDWPDIATRNLDRPIKFTVDAGLYEKSTPTKLRSVIKLKPIADRYISRLIEGRTIRGKAAPAVIKLNRFGNIPNLKKGKKIAALIAKRDHFRAQIKGIDAVWKRTKSGVIPVIVFDRPLTPRRRFEWDRLMAQAVRARILPNARHEIQRAVDKASRA